MVAPLITKVEAKDFDARAVHVATVSLAHKVMLLVVGCVILVLALVALAGAGADCWWRRCCRDTATREYRRCSARRRLVQATLRDEIRVVSWRRGLSTRELKKDLIKRLLHEDGAQALTEEAAAALPLVRRRLGSKPGGFALSDDAGQSGGSSRRAGRSLSTMMDVRRSRVGDVGAPGGTTLDEAFG